MKTILVLFFMFAVSAKAEEKMELLKSPSITASEDEGLYPPEKLEPLPKKKERAAGPDVSKLAKLDMLEPFEEVIVLQRRYLPRTHRLELSPTVGYVLNENFFNDTLFGARLGYGFTESLGVELSYLNLQASKREVTTNLAAERGLATASLVTPSQYMGLSAKWSPIFGKIALFSKRIVPFDTFFQLGGGTTTTNTGTSAMTVMLGSGQTYSIRQWLAFRWDFGLFNYNAKSSISGTEETVTDLHVNIGVSFFFPSAGYR